MIGNEEGLLYRINNKWLFELYSMTGFKVINKKGRPSQFVEAFRIQEYYQENPETGYIDSLYRLDKAIEDVPVGVVRRAIHIVELAKQGKLDLGGAVNGYGNGY